MKTLICLVRHGQTDWNKAHLIQGRFDNPLNDTGKEQLYQTGLKIKSLNITWDVYLSSPLSRAIESQQIIKNVLTGSKDNIIIRPNLIEREFGDADGKPIEEKIYQDIMNDNIYGMETSKDIQTRALKEINELAKIYPNKNLLIVTHSHFIKAVFTSIDKQFTFRDVISNGGLNFIEIEDKKIISYQQNA